MPKHAFHDLPATFRLDDCPSDASPGMTRSEGLAALAALQVEMEAWQDKLYACRKAAVLVILQGMDASGKDGTIRRIFSAISPQGLATHAFRLPTPEEQAHDFLWRAHLRMPERGGICIFNRSYYEAVASDLVQGMIDARTRDRRCQDIRHFESMLQANGIALVKCFLHISKDEQKARLRKRLAEPGKRWKFATADLENRARWDDYLAAWSVAIRSTGTRSAPWHVIPADRKWYRDLAVAELLVESLRGIAPDYPQPRLAVTADDIQ